MGCLALSWAVADTPGFHISGLAGLFIALVIAPAFHHLTVVDEGERLAIRFGPIRLFSRTVRYVDIESVETGRTLLLDGWGIHLSVRGGWVWNLWGRDCVVIRFKNDGVLRVGSDDGQKLTGFLEQKIGERGKQPWQTGKPI